jgi:hypothetical protein
VTDRIELGVSQADDCPSPAKIASDEALETRIAVIVDDDDDVVRQVKFVVQRRAAIVKNTYLWRKRDVSVSKDGPLLYVYSVSKTKKDTQAFVPNVEGRNR